MHIPSWLRLPSRLALLLGLGALSAAGAKADTGESHPGSARVPQQSVKTFGDLSIWSEGGRIFVAESGQEARELPLGDTAEARRLRDMLGREGAIAAAPRELRDRIILVGGGGVGFSWAPPRPPDSAATRGPSKPSNSGATVPAGQNRAAPKPIVTTK